MNDPVRKHIKRIGNIQKGIIRWMGLNQGVTSRKELRERWDAKETIETTSLKYPLEAAKAGFNKIMGTYKPAESEKKIQDLIVETIDAMTPQERLELLTDPLNTEIAKIKLDSEKDRLANITRDPFERTTTIEEKPTKYAQYLSDNYFDVEETTTEEPDTYLSDGWLPWNIEAILSTPPSKSQSTSYSKAILGLEKRKLVECARTRGKKSHITYVKLTFFGEVASVLLWENQSKKKTSS